jgi:hypothetical protein
LIFFATAAAFAGAAAAFAGVAGFPVKFVPHEGQNAAPSSIGLPQLVQKAMFFSLNRNIYSRHRLPTTLAVSVTTVPANGDKPAAFS